jgi:excisionase family DNA binding protein
VAFLLETKKMDAREFPAVSTVHEACDLLKLSRVTLYKLIGADRLRTFKIGRKRLISGEATEFVRTNEHPEV